MPRQSTTNGLLSIILQEIGYIQASSPAMEIFLRPKINQFLKVNTLAIVTLNKHVAMLGDLYVKKDDKGQGMIEKGADGNMQLVFNDADAEQAYKKAYDELMNKRIELIVDTEANQIPINSLN
jgi:calcineurin-like phosphoesterase family protein